MHANLRAALLCSVSFAFLCAAPIPPALAADIAELPNLNAAPSETSVSGLSSGAFMAVQFGTVWSSIVKGVGVVAGGPYDCAQAQAADSPSKAFATATGPCMKGPPPSLDIFVKMATDKAVTGGIDPLTNLRAQKVYVFHGFNDAFVAQSVTDATAAFYRHFQGEAGRGNLFYQTSIGAGHAFAVDRPAVSGVNGCKDNSEPHIVQCDYDQAGILLQHIYGALSPRNTGVLAGSLKSFAQTAYMPVDTSETFSMANEGYVFIPKDCEEGAACRVHIALHGCKQSAATLGRKFVEDTGYLNWADTNRIIVLFPQAEASSGNPAACWDWWSYITHDDSYITKSGRQITVIKAMVDALTSGAKPAGKPAPAALDMAPPNLIVNDVSDSAVALTWGVVPGAEAYRVTRIAADGTPVLAGIVSAPGFADAGLPPSTAFRWRVSAVVGGVEGPATSEIAASTRATPAACHTPGLCPLMQSEK